MKANPSSPATPIEVYLPDNVPIPENMISNCSPAHYINQFKVVK